MSLPTDPEIIAFVRGYEAAGDGPPPRADVVKAFGAKGQDRVALRKKLQAMEADGAIALEGRPARRADREARRADDADRPDLPKVTVLDVTGTDAEGDLLAAPARWEGEPPRIVLTDAMARRVKPPLGAGDRFLGRLHARGDAYEAEPIKRLAARADRVLGVLSTTRGGGVVEPVSRKANPVEVNKDDLAGAKDGDLVFVSPKRTRRHGPSEGVIDEVVGPFGDSASWSLIALANNDIPTEFPREAISEAEAAQMPPPEGREDLRGTPLVTIDPADAKDHDDAVYAEATGTGFRLLVAIADVSWFVRPGSALDREARRRGNSVYLVDRVVPMLPEALSNGLCSLHEGEDRPALVCEIEIDGQGEKTKHRFFRATMRSAASLSYEEAQVAADGRPSARAKPLKATVIDPLFAAYEALRRARADRQPLDLELPERKIVLDDQGAVEKVILKDRFDAHKLIEAMMVLANVCAAETLEAARRTLIYRVHDQPDPERLEALRQYLDTLGYAFPKGERVRPELFNRTLAKAAERDEADMVSMSVLRTQSQAVYDTDNLGHFGLNLARYAHFTSPIRRYADLTVHRSLVAANKLGPGAEETSAKETLQETAEAISDTERRAVSAERETQDRFLAAFLEGQVGGEFAGRVNGVTRAGLFVTLDETGADGFVPARSLGWEYFEHVESENALVGRESGGRYGLGQKVRVRLVEVTPLQGGLRFEMLTEPEKGDKPKRSAKGNHRKGQKRADRKTGSRGAATGRPAATRADNPRTRDEPAAERPRRPKTAEAPPKLERRPRKAKPTTEKPPKGTKAASPKKPAKSGSKTTPRRAAKPKAKPNR